MKNVLFIDVDTDREKVVMVGKPSTVAQPTNPDEAKKMLMDDISCVCETLCTLIQIADQNQYGNKEDLVNTSKTYLTKLLDENKSQKDLEVSK